MHRNCQWEHRAGKQQGLRSKPESRRRAGAIRRGVEAAIAFLATATALMVVAGTAHALPADYAYEQVSPAEKGATFVTPSFSLGYGEQPATAGNGGDVYASANGSAVAYTTMGGSLDPDATIVPLIPEFLASRGDDFWSTAFVGGQASKTPGFVAADVLTRGPYSVSLDRAAFVSPPVSTPPTHPVTGEPYRPSVWIRDNASGEFTEIAPDPAPGGADYPSGTFAAPTFLASDRALETAVFATPAELTTDAVPLPDEDPKIYRWRAGELDLVGVGEPLAMENWNSLDAVYYTDTDNELQRWDESGTVWVSEEENSSADPSPTGVIRSDALAARTTVPSYDGDRVVFAANQGLTDDDPDPNGSFGETDIFLYDHSKSSDSNLTRISADNEPADGVIANPQLVAVSEDAHRIYFTTGSQIVSGGPIVTLQSGSQDGERYLFMWDDSSGTPTVKYVGIVGCIEMVFCTKAAGRSPWRISPDGSHFAFRSGTDMTADDDGGQIQIYIYEAVTSGPLSPQLSCVSCNALNDNPFGEAEFRAPVGMFRTSRNVLDDGRVYFMTQDRLTADDQTTTSDVYVWQDGSRQLLSSGTSGRHSVLGDVSANGESVFFTTFQSLVGWDVDENNDLYVARQGGGFAEPEPQMPGCNGDECQGEAPPPPRGQSPSTSELSGSGNPAGSKSDCRALDRRANRLAGKQRRLARKASKATKKAKQAGDGSKARLKRKAKQATRRAKQAKHASKKAKRRATACQSGGGR